MPPKPKSPLPPHAKRDLAIKKSLGNAPGVLTNEAKLLKNIANESLSKALAELKRRKETTQLAETECFDKQLAFIRDPEKNKILFTPRRSGKTTAIGVYLLQEALNYSNRKFLYLGISKDSAEGAIWKDIIEPYLNKKGILFSYHNTKRILTLPNKSTIKFAGLDIAPNEVTKLVGGKYHMAIIDECQDITQDLQYIIEKLSPGLGDWIDKGGGVLVLAGTPGTLTGDNFWWKATKQDADGFPDPTRLKGWSLHEWNVEDNPHYVEPFKIVNQQFFDRLGPNYRSDPAYRREWLGKWCLDPGLAVYKFEPSLNLFKTDGQDWTPERTNQAFLLKHSLLSNKPNWTYTLGVDLGYEDATAFVLGAYSSLDKHFYVVESAKYNHSIMSALAAIMTDYRRRYKIDLIHMDTSGAGKIMAESFVKEYGLPVVAADKGFDKAADTARMNSDFLAGNIQVIEERNLALIAEWSALILNQKKLKAGVWEELKSKDNHLADACRYAYKSALHFLGNPQEPRDVDYLDEYLEQQKRRDTSFKKKDIYQVLREKKESNRLVSIFRNKK